MSGISLAREARDTPELVGKFGPFGQSIFYARPWEATEDSAITSWAHEPLTRLPDDVGWEPDVMEGVAPSTPAGVGAVIRYAEGACDPAAARQPSRAKSFSTMLDHAGSTPGGGS